ncbi:MAG: 16S rRNA (guanine(966)-N(2))-methyltransferase RsmD [Zetaproteobacteria bacterium]|nr:16S rRNA (guanine(966)-N(2))-methyltransferase RsmD [Zetaproteobacteria bacterium]
MRVTGGEFRGRKIKVPNIDGVRPTPSRVREALFNMMGNIQGQRGLDLFSGSGMMAVEALSRGAEHIISVESDGKVCRYLDKVLLQFELSKHWKIQHGELPQVLGVCQGQTFDFIFADPPYGKGFTEKIFLWLEQQGIKTSLLILEESSQVDVLWVKGWDVETRQYGHTCLHLCRKLKTTASSVLVD